MSYFLREIDGVCSTSSTQLASNVPEDRKSARRLRKLLYKCAENTCKTDILRVPAYCGKVEPDDDKSPIDPQQQINFHDILNSKFVVGPPSPFALVAIAKSILARFGNPEEKSESDERGEEDGNRDDDTKPYKNTDQLVGASLTAIFGVLDQLSRRDADLCVQALESLLSLIQSMPIECLQSENRLSMSAMISVLMLLRENGCPSVSSKATSCLVALAVACGEPEHLSSTIRSLICMKKNLRMSADSTYDMIQMPENLRRLLLKVRRKALGGDDLNSRPTWSQIDVHDHSIASSFSLPSLPDNSPSTDTPDDDNRIHSSTACDGTFLYILNYVGLYKLGTGLNDTISGKLYAANQGLKSSKNVQMYLCNGSLYLRRNYSSCISVIDTDSLLDIGEVILPPTCVQNALFTDGTYFYSATLIANSTLSTIQLNDSFSPSLEPSARKSHRLTDVHFTPYGDIQTPHQLPESLPANLHPQVVDLHTTRELAFIQARSGKVYYAGNGTRFGLFETGNTWMELCLPEQIVQVSVGIDTIMFRSGAGHGWIASIDDKKRSGRLRKIVPLNRRKIIHVCASGNMYGFVTENGKVFMGGLHTMRVNVSNSMLCGLDTVTVASLALGKSHGVAVARNGHLYTWGLNNMNQCGRTAESTSSATSSPRHSARQEYQICPIGEHTWLNDTPSVCAQCGLCSARGVACGRSRLVFDVVSVGLVERSLNQRPGRAQHVPFSSTAAPQRSTLSPARLLLSKGPGDVKVSSVSCGNFHTVVLASDRKVFTFGSNCHGQLGVGDTLSKNCPQQVKLPQDVIVVQVAAGANHTVLRANDGSVYTFGAFGKGQLARPAGEKTGWNALPERIPGYGPGTNAFAGWIGADGDSTIIHNHTALLSSDNILKAQIVANKTNIFIFPREVGKDYIVIRRKQNVFEHHQSDHKCWYSAWATDPKYDMLWYYNSAEMEIKGYDIFKKTEKIAEDAFESLTYMAGAEFAVQVYDHPTYATAMSMGIQLLSATFSANVINLSEFWKERNGDKDQESDRAVMDGYSVANRFDGTGGGWGYSPHSIEAIQFKVNKEIRLVGVGLYGGRGEYISKLKLYRQAGVDADELYVEQITETDETVYDCGAHETATLLFSQPIVIQPSHWHVVSAKISGPSSDCGANGKPLVECDGVTFQFKNSVVSNNGTDVNVGQIPELYYQVVGGSENRDEIDTNKPLTISREMSNLFSPMALKHVNAEGIGNLLHLLNWALQRVQAEDESEESAEKQWTQERYGFIALLCMKLISRFIRTVYKEKGHQEEPGIDFANKIVTLHSMLLEFFFSPDMSDYQNRPLIKREEKVVEEGYTLMQCVSEAVRLFVSLSHCFMGSRNLVNAHLLAVMNKGNYDQKSLVLTAAVIGSLAKIDRFAHQLLGTTYNGDRFPMLSSLLLKHFNCEKETLATLTSFPNILRFLYDQTFLRNAFENTSGLAEKILVKVSKELAIPADESMLGPVVHQTSSRFRKRSSQPTWDMSDGCADAMAFRVDSEGIKLHGFGIYLPLEPDRRNFIGEILMLSPDSSEKWTCLLRVSVEMSVEEKEVGIVRFPEYVLLSPGVTYAVKVSMTKNAKTFCGEGGVTQVQLLNGARLFFSGCSMSQNGTNVQRGQLPFLLYSILDQSISVQIKQDTIHETFILLLRLMANKIGGAIMDGEELPACCQHLVSHISPHVMVFMERFPDKALELMSTVEQLIPMVSNLNGVERAFHSYDSNDSGCDAPYSGIITTIVESPHPYKPNTSSSIVCNFDDADYVCVRFSPDCQTAQFDDQLTIYLKIDEHSYMPVERCYGNEWPNYPMVLPGNCLLFVLDAASAVEGATSDQMFGYHLTVTGYLVGYKNPTMRLEQDLVWLSANACRIMSQLPVNSSNIQHLSTAEDDTRHLFEKHGSLLKKGLSLSHSPTLSELCTKGHPPPAQSADLQFLREFLSGNISSSAGFLAKWLPTGPVVDPSKCQLTLSHDELIVGKAVTLKLSCRDQYNREVDCPKLQVEGFASLGHRNPESTITNELLHIGNLPSSLLIHQNPFQPMIVNQTRYMNIAAMPAYANYSVEEIRLGFMVDELVKDRVPLKPTDSSVFAGSWTPTTAGRYCIECKVDGFDISHKYNVEVAERKSGKGEDRHAAQMVVAKTVSIPFSSDFSGIRMRLGTTLASQCAGVIPSGALVEYIEEIENEDGKWIRLTDETSLLYGCNPGAGPVWCLSFHKPLQRELIPLGKDKDREKAVKLRKKEIEKESSRSKHHSVSMDAKETYILSPNDILQVYSAPAPHSMIDGEKISGPCDLSSSGWMENRHGVWIKLTGVEKYVLQKTDPSSETSLSFSTNGNDEEDLERPMNRKKTRLPNALTPSVADCIRAVFAAFVWHEHLVKDLMAAASYLKFHQNLHGIWQTCEIPSCTNAPAALQPIVKIWREICEVVETSVEQHLIMPPVSNKVLNTESLKPPSSSGGCELCDANITVPLTVHLRMAHPGCGGDCLGYGYNSNGKFTTGWSGECGAGGRGQSPWYLLCNNCRSQYLRKTPAGHHQERTRRWREFRFSTSASDARPEVIIRQNALFLLDLNSRLQTDSNNSSTTTSGWTINLFPTISTPSTMPRSQRRLDVPQSQSIQQNSYMKLGYSSDPGPKVNVIMSPPDHTVDQATSLNYRPGPSIEPAEVLQSPSAALRTLFSNTNPSTSALLKRPVLAFCVEHHDLKRIRAACVQSVRRAVSFAHAFRVWNWLLRMVSSEYSVSDIILQYLTTLTSYNRLAEYMFSAKKNTNVLPHPWRLCFLAGPIAADMVTQLHAFLHTVSIILQSAGVDGRLKSLCFKSWTLQLTAQEQDLLILTCNILGTVGGILSDTSIVDADNRFVKELKDITKFAEITASSRQAMVICLTDGSGETFWESGEEDKNRTRSLTVKLDENAKGELLALYIDNARDDGYRISAIAFKATLEDGRTKSLTTLNLEPTYCGWVKCCINDIHQVTVQFKGPNLACRIRQLVISGHPVKQSGSPKMVPSTSHHLFSMTLNETRSPCSKRSLLKRSVENYRKMIL
uniref:DOC domain-containing protein n=1 Tax=Caenorhabditis tropicalis TaxID=1561998 RepID=A0A1I7UJB5_9PELO